MVKLSVKEIVAATSMKQRVISPNTWTPKQSEATGKTWNNNGVEYLFCAECCDFVVRQSGPRHIYEVHLEECLFECNRSTCGFFSTYSYDDVRSHISEKHPELKGSAALPLSHVDTFEIEITDWTRRCWSTEQGTTCDHAEKSKRIPLVTRVHDAFEEVQRTSNSCPKVRPPSLRNAIKRKRKGVEDESPLGARFSSKKPNKEAPLNYPYCGECQKTLSTWDRKTHMYRHHVKKADMFKCPKCDTFSKGSKYNIKAHMAAVHGSTTEEVVSKESEYAKEIEQWERRCWGHRSLPTSATTPPKKDLPG
uniref:C2H2-type domain-containing protein n=1 Tax=Plectus sambesii TaxID=2011161 RepID=A0A914VVI5_9BILA